MLSRVLPGACGTAVVVLALSRVIKSVVTEEAPVTLEPKNTQGERKKTHLKCL